MWFYFHSSESLCNCNDVCSGLEFVSLSSFRFLREWIVNVSFSNELLGMAILLEPCPIHFWIIRTLLTIDLCYPILYPWSSVYVKDSHFQCPFRNSIPYTSVFSNKRVCSHICLFQQKGLLLICNAFLWILQWYEWKWWMVFTWERKAILCRYWMLIERQACQKRYIVVINSHI